MIKTTQSLEQLGFESWLSNYVNSAGSFVAPCLNFPICNIAE